MADREYTPHQQRIIRTWYRNQDASRAQRFAELVTEVYLAATPKKQAQLWDRVRKLLEEGGLPAGEADALVAARDVEALARLAQGGFGEAPPAPPGNPRGGGGRRG